MVLECTEVYVQEAMVMLRVSGVVVMGCGVRRMLYGD